MEDYEMALLNEPDVTTTRSNGAARDTTPDLTWSFGTLDVARRNEDGRLGSDYSVIGIMIRGSRYQAVLGKARITDWDKGDGHRLLEVLKAKYLKTEKDQYLVLERYEGPDNEKLDRPFAMTEMWTVIGESNKRSAPGRDS
ncbi:hypothetical protein MRX96_054953 [Rhipicephalus microplus]